MARDGIGEVEVRLPHRGDSGGVDGVDVPLAERRAQRLVEDRLAAETSDHDRGRNLALAESGDAHLATELAGSLLEAALNLLGRNLGIDAHARLGQFGDIRLQRHTEQTIAVSRY